MRSMLHAPSSLLQSRRRFIRNFAGLLIPAYLGAGRPLICDAQMAFVPHRRKSFGFVYHPEVLDWEARVIANGSSLTTAMKNAAQVWRTDVNSIRSKVRRRNFFGGNNFLAAQVPFIKDAGSALDAPYVGSTPGSGSNWTYSETGSSGGLKPLTANAWLDTGLYPFFDIASVDSCGISVYIRDAVAENSVRIGCGSFGTANQWLILAAWSDGNTYCNIGANQFGGSADAVKKGFYSLSRTSSSSAVLYRDAVSIATTSAPGGALPTGAVAVFAYQDNTGNPQLYCTNTFGGYVIYEGLDATEIGILNTAEVKVQTALARNV